MKHPLTITGAVVLAGSWLLLLFGSGGDEYRSIINLHKLAIAHAGITSGVGMIVAGLIADGLNRLLLGSAPIGTAPPTDPAIASGERTMSPEELTKALAEARAKLDKP